MICIYLILNHQVADSLKDKFVLKITHISSETYSKLAHFQRMHQHQRNPLYLLKMRLIKLLPAICLEICQYTCIPLKPNAENC